MDVLGDALDWLEQQRRSYAAIPATYSRGWRMFKDVPISIVTSDVDLDTTVEGVDVGIPFVTILISEDDLGILAPPQPGDVITTTDPARPATFAIYEVTARGDSCWERIAPNSSTLAVRVTRTS